MPGYVGDLRDMTLATAKKLALFSLDIYQLEIYHRQQRRRHGRSIGSSRFPNEHKHDRL